MANVFIGTLIFGYAGWIMVRFVKKSKKGACTSCPVNTSCSKKNCHDIDVAHKVD